MNETYLSTGIYSRNNQIITVADHEYQKESTQKPMVHLLILNSDCFNKIILENFDSNDIRISIFLFAPVMKYDVKHEN